ncbi:uncharacterized protein LOC110249544 [Exaiptasia diaphana]|uniref:Uncharacterized protein n=1 Tax=Exaiptasia diaphana TaxID=2652724 RepID=A0A913XXC9_EXADI|nr:uncharacterized protein LOC110249544 [Exaiptasia diaphana]KXJ23983.1 hypothetical protein AC249_AIPGENE164 [Exaiptasia diaphana]
MKIDPKQSLMEITSASLQQELCSSQFQASPPPRPNQRARGSEGTPKCWYCKGEEDETIDHFFLSCAKFNEIRASLLIQLKEQLEALGDQGMHAWLSFERGSVVLQSQIILGVLSFGGVVDDVIDKFRNQYVAKAWNERIVI